MLLSKTKETEAERKGECDKKQDTTKHDDAVGVAGVCVLERDVHGDENVGM